jgi:hypothetical protein
MNGSVAFCNPFVWGIVLGTAACGQDYKIEVEARNFVLNPELSDLGNVAIGSTETFYVDATSTGGGDIAILAVEIVNVEGEFIASADEEMPSVIESESTTTFSFTYTPEFEGYHWAQITVRTDLEEDNERLVEARGQAAVPVVKVWPGIIDFGPVSPGSTAVDTIHVANEGTVPVEVDTLTFDNGVFTTTESLPVRVGSGETAALSVSFVPGDGDEQTGTSVVVLTSGATLDPVVLRGNACSTASGDLYDQDSDGYSICSVDCDDRDPGVHPGAVEVCNAIDDNCDGIVDEGTECYDDDGDGLSENEGDCNDGDASVYPGAIENPSNGVDDDCDGMVDSGATDRDGDGYGETGGDCDEWDASTYPGAPELEDGIDNDCDGIIDEGTDSYDDDGDGLSEREGDCDDSSALISPDAPEIPDWRDNDCDGIVDEDTAYRDDDGDGFSELGGDCDDDDPDINPGELEIEGDGIDNNCDGTIE